MAKKLTFILLLLLTLLGGILRFWRLESSPSGALIDELHFGYLAYSLIQTGADEHGQSWPLIFEGFGDRKLPAMAYLDIPSVAIWGLSLLAIRVPSALAGTALILAMFWLTLELTKRKKWALLAAFITAISPWSFFLSRFGFESNIALLAFVVALAALLKAHATHKMLFYILSGASFAATWYSYVAYRPITIVLLATYALYVLYTNRTKKTLKSVAVLLGAFALFVLPLFSPAAISVNSTRFEQVGITSEPGTDQTINEKRTFCAMQFHRFFCDAAFNKATFFFQELTHRYVSAYSPQFLATKGELTTDFLTVDSFGQFFPVLYPLFILGIAGIIFSTKTTLTPLQKWLIFVGLLVSPLPTAVVGEPQKVRLSALFPFLVIAITYGAIFVEQLLPKKAFSYLFTACLVTALLGYSFLYQMQYHSVQMIQNEYKYQSYAPGLHQYLGSLPDNMLINIVPFYSDPLMFHAFYTKMDPREYQKLAVVDDYDGANFKHTVELGNVWAYKHSPEHMSCIGLEKNMPTIYVTKEKFEDLPLLHTQKASNGVHTYVFVYDITKFMKAADCEERFN